MDSERGEGVIWVNQDGLERGIGLWEEWGVLRLGMVSGVVSVVPNIPLSSFKTEKMYGEVNPKSVSSCHELPLFHSQRQKVPQVPEIGIWSVGSEVRPPNV